VTDTRNKNRQERLKAALRENLKRRKQQARGRASGAGPRTEADPMAAGERDEGAARETADKPE
jgi:hypothetical protein